MTGPTGQTTQTIQTGRVGETARTSGRAAADRPAPEAPRTDGRQPCAA